MEYNYKKLGNQCNSTRNTALTSNYKFLKPLDNIYWKDWQPLYILKDNTQQKKNCM